MSTLYNLEPQPTGKAILHTTTGSITVELFAHQCPLACRSFLQHCLDGYYTNTTFHRLVPNFILQGGDPTNTGSGGVSALDPSGAPFADEFHSRLKFNRRGLLGMANSGAKDDNGSQFFFTLGATPELTGRNTMFGRVEGNTIFNLVKMGEAELTDVEGSERPLYPTVVTGAEVLVNPFEDMVKRVTVAVSTATMRDSAPPKKKQKKKSGKQMLSFGDDEGDEDSVVPAAPRAKFNPKLVQAGADPLPRSARQSPIIAETIAQGQPLLSRPGPREVRRDPTPSPTPTPSASPSPPTSPKQSQLSRTNDQIAALKASLKRTTHTNTASDEATDVALTYGKTSLVPEGATRGRKRTHAGQSGERQAKKSLQEFNAFKARLNAAGAASGINGDRSKGNKSGENGALATPSAASINGKSSSQHEEDEEEEPCELHFVPGCQSCKKWDAADAGVDLADTLSHNKDEDDDNGTGLMTHALSFAKDRLGKDLEWKRSNEKELVVIDPREREKDILKSKNKRRK